MGFQYFLLIIAGFIAGAIDSIAGGGGLITLPTLGMVLEPGVASIGTNKIVGLTGAFMALVVYARKVKMPVGLSIAFSLWIVPGSLCGSRISPLIPKEIFPWILLGTYPIILWVLWRKDLWIQHEDLSEHKNKKFRLLDAFVPRLALTGFLCGFYDGMWGPGGGTFMLLGLFLIVKLPLMPAVAASKLANTFSAGTALMSYGQQGYVNIMVGSIMALGVCLGATAGAHYASKKSATIVRPILLLVSTALVIKNIIALWRG